MDMGVGLTVLVAHDIIESNHQGLLYLFIMIDSLRQTPL